MFSIKCTTGLILDTNLFLITRTLFKEIIVKLDIFQPSKICEAHGTFSSASCTSCQESYIHFNQNLIIHCTACFIIPESCFPENAIYSVPKIRIFLLKIKRRCVFPSLFCSQYSIFFYFLLPLLLKHVQNKSHPLIEMSIF